METLEVSIVVRDLGESLDASGLSWRGDSRNSLALVGTFYDRSLRGGERMRAVPENTEACLGKTVCGKIVRHWAGVNILGGVGGGALRRCVSSQLPRLVLLSALLR